MLREEIAGLSPNARKLLDAVMNDMESGDDTLLDVIGEHRYNWRPVSMDQFLSDEYYLGQSTQTLYPRIREDLCESLGTHNYREMVLTGSIGYGKTTFLSVAICRMLYELSCLRAPQLAYGLSPGSELVIALMSKSLHLSRTVMMSAVVDKIKLSPYFEEHFKPTYGREVTKFPGNIMMAVGSCNSERMLGMNVVGGAMDEANFMATKGQVIGGGTGGGVKKTVAQFDLAEKVYASLVRRIKSRFLKAPADLPGMMVLVSSAATMGSFTDRKIKDANNDPTVFVRDYSAWDVKPESHFSGETFDIVIGSSSLRSRIVNPGEVLDVDWLKENGSRVISVPIEYVDDFKRDLENAIRDIAGISTHAISAFIHRIEKVDECISPRVVHPFSVDQYDYGKPGEFIWDRVCDRKKRNLRGGFEEDYWVPKLNPNALRYVHIDPSLSGDSTGLAMGHVDRWIEVVRRSPDGEEYSDVAPHIVIDLMLRINPPFGEQIFLPDVRRLVYELMSHGYQLCGFSCDQYQSAEMIQQMKARGVRSGLLSVDSTTKAYDALKSSIYENRIEYYGYSHFLQELKALEYNRIRGKVDHPAAGSKDVSDAVAGVVQGLIESVKSIPLAPDPTRLSGQVDSDHSWVTEGKIPWNSNNPVPTRPSVDIKGPLPIIMG